MSYTQSRFDDFVVRDADGVLIPKNEENRDYRAVLAWVAQGNAIAPYAPPIDEVKAEYKSLVDAAAEAVRAKYVTTGAGMAMTYQEKFAQAEAVNQLGQAAADALTVDDYVAAYPVLAASVGIEAGSLWDCAQLVIGKYVGFNAVAHEIEKTRLQAKAEINAASDRDGVLAAYEAITWTV